jgi:hypothetical protein
LIKNGEFVRLPAHHNLEVAVVTAVTLAIGLARDAMGVVQVTVVINASALHGAHQDVANPSPDSWFTIRTALAAYGDARLRAGVGAFGLFVFASVAHVGMAAVVG